MEATPLRAFARLSLGRVREVITDSPSRETNGYIEGTFDGCIGIGDHAGCMGMPDHEPTGHEPADHEPMDHGPFDHEGDIP